MKGNIFQYLCNFNIYSKFMKGNIYAIFFCLKLTRANLESVAVEGERNSGVGAAVVINSALRHIQTRAFSVQKCANGCKIYN